MKRDEIRRAEEAAFRAWPGETCRDIGGWLACASGTGFSRGNSVWPLRFSGGLALDEAISAAEGFYHSRSQETRFQVLDVAEPDGLDAALAARGYLHEQPSLLMIKDGLSSGPAPQGCESAERPGAEWLAVYGKEIAPKRRASVEAILARLPAPHAYFSWRTGGGVGAICLCVGDGDHAVVQAMTTRADMRRRGGARRLLAAAETWAAGQGARRVALQVDAENVAALRLYERCGFAVVSGYRYRVLRKELAR